jgi:hypothetical protein
MSGAQQQRDAALVRIARARRATIVGAGGLTVGLAAFVSAIAPGHTLGAKVATNLTADAHTSGAAPARSTSTSLRMPSLASPSQLGLQGADDSPQAAAPQQSAPQPSQGAPAQQAPVQQAAPAAVSGGS